MATELETAQDMYSRYIEAEKAILGGQSYSIAGRSLSRADLAEVTRQRNFWYAETKRLGRGGMTVKAVVPRDI